MKLFLILLGFALTCVAAYSPDLKLKFGDPSVEQNVFMPYYMEKNEAISKGYEPTSRPDGPLPELVLYCEKNDKRVCLFFDDETGYICGINIGILQDDLSNAVFDWDIQGWTKWNVDEDGNTATYFTKQVYLCSSEYLNMTKDERIEARTKNKVTPEEALWVTGFNKEIARLPINDWVDTQTDYTIQQFFPLMGLHYYYNMTPTTQCLDNTMYPWFILVQEKNIIALGLMIFANVAENSNFELFEKPTRAVVEYIVNSGPDCVYELAEKPGVRTLHIYFIDSPQNILSP